MRFGLRARVIAAVVVVTTTATAVMAFSAARIQEDDALDRFTAAAKTSFGAMFGQAWPHLEQFMAGSPQALDLFSQGMNKAGADWMLVTRYPQMTNDDFTTPQGPAEVVKASSKTVDWTTGIDNAAPPDRKAALEGVKDVVLLRTTGPENLLSTVTIDPATGRKLLVVSANFVAYWVVQYFDLTRFEQDLAAQRWKLVWIALGVTVLGVAAAVFAAGGIQRPVRRVASAARELGDGAFDVRVPVKGRDELADLAQSFNTMADRVGAAIEELRAKDRQQQRFVADVAHDLRTPLASMVATVDTLDSSSPEIRSRATELLGTQTRRLARLVEDLMEISRFDAGSADFRPEPVDLPALVEDAIGAAAPETPVEVTSTGDTTIVADPRRLHTVVVNLLVNAARYGRTPITVTLTGAADAVWIRVADSGPGIPEDLLPILFDRFVRGDHARQATEGSGLGLSIARENALIHGGELTAHNDGGAVFTVSLPRESPA
ncbi:sensor histidine kinase [Amycolatopsis azurea]|uniref:Signal transduction histidine-protein kinase/phosphatase MprB n=1 Tax=Amycolatopsis azurea DSM 43854 TaxID=1238180 RepID=M2PXY6_9PSEU|nr:HAMP domain-containing sensor histidine kinase [Amycolatopsis azurea]EMD24530.1 two component system histidine kinase [Amycolatopsis azurea DSM 43854]OOC02018.1 two-component sensor histidine kinase [Amycolatopsis azurea DSM 43854]